jgi:hypothetical protein
MKRFMASLICTTLAGLFYVSMEVEAVKTGYAIRKQEEMKVQLLDRGRALKYNIAHLESPRNLERKLAAQKILLAAPKEWQTLVLSGSKAARPSPQAASALNQPPQFLRFFVGTAQAEAKDTR